MWISQTTHKPGFSGFQQESLRGVAQLNFSKQINISSNMWLKNFFLLLVFAFAVAIIGVAAETQKEGEVNQTPTPGPPNWAHIKSPGGWIYDVSSLATIDDQLVYATTPAGDGRYYGFAVTRAQKEGCGYIGVCTAPGSSGVCQALSPGSIWSQLCLAPYSNSIGVTGLDGNGGVEIDYPKAEGNFHVLMKITCRPTQPPDSITVTIVDNEPNYEIICESKFGCSSSTPSASKLSGGTFFCIFLLIIIVLYIVAGILYNKFRKHQEGLHLLPNFEFWRIVPGLIKDGALFVRHKGHPPDVQPWKPLSEYSS